MVGVTNLAGAALALAAISSAQTYSACNPMKQDGCPSKPGLTTKYTADFTQGLPAKWTTTSGTVGTGSQGAEFTIKALGDGPTMQSDFYIMFGYVEMKVQAAPGSGIVSSFVLESDDLDEIDWVCNLNFNIITYLTLL
jgi:hypothetical protein